ncbi:hypothetical protein [Maricaulis sp.]|uniref:hypothetical protein n=1 Tax=Maricaulis sp. TaxID=1486257 RepID=UPI003A8D1DEC
MEDASHNDILRELGALSERVKNLTDDVEEGFDRADRMAAKAGSERHEIFRRLRHIENARAIESGIDAGVAQLADRWRDRLYAVLRFLLPSGFAAGLVAWWFENFR